MTGFLLGPGIFILLTVLLALARILSGPGDAGRLMASQLLGTGGVAALLLLSSATDLTAATDLALALLLLAELAAIAFLADSSAPSPGAAVSSAAGAVPALVAPGRGGPSPCGLLASTLLALCALLLGLLPPALFSLLDLGREGMASAAAEEAFIDADARDYAGLDSQVSETSERNHGRVETRRYRTLGNLEGVPRSALWKGLNMIGMVESRREVDGQPSTEYRFYIGSIGTDAARFARAVRGHWGIENYLHWSLDVAFREDESRLRDPEGREKFAVLRHLALSRLKND
mgnify:CR=1 FL=1